MNDKSYDVFLSYSSTDRGFVRAVAERLHKEAKLRVWFDEWSIPPGDPWQEALEAGLEESASVVVFLGPQGIRTWQNEEMRSALESRTADPTFRVVPAILPGARKPDSLPRFLRRLSWVEFTSAADEDALWGIQCGIAGRPPGRSRSDLEHSTRVREEDRGHCYDSSRQGASQTSEPLPAPSALADRVPEPAISTSSNRAPRHEDAPNRTPSSRALISRWSVMASVFAALLVSLLTLVHPWSDNQSQGVGWLIRVVRASDSRSVPNAKVIFYADGGPYEALSDSRGAAKLPSEARGKSGRLMVETAEYAIHEQELEARQRVDIRLEKRPADLHHVLFRVVDEKGRPLTRAEVQLFLGADSLIQITDDHGLVKFEAGFRDGKSDARININHRSCNSLDQRLTLKPESVQDVQFECPTHEGSAQLAPELPVSSLEQPSVIPRRRPT